MSFYVLNIQVGKCRISIDKSSLKQTDSTTLKPENVTTLSIKIAPNVTHQDNSDKSGLQKEEPATIQAENSTPLSHTLAENVTSQTTRRPVKFVELYELFMLRQDGPKLSTQLP